MEKTLSESGGKENMKKYACLLISMIIGAGMLCGCADSIPQMSNEEEALVTEYATNLLVKHSTLTDRTLLDAKEMEMEIANETAKQERLKKTKELQETYLNASNDSAVDKETTSTENTSASATKKEPEQTSCSFSEFLQEDGFSIEYTSYMLCDSYPENSEDEFYVAMDASAGKQLCVLTFSANNRTDTEKELNILQKKCRFSVKIDGGDAIFAQATLLTDDLSSYAGTIPAGGTEQMVLVFEIPDDITWINSMQLVMADSQGDNTITLE